MADDASDVATRKVHAAAHAPFHFYVSSAILLLTVFFGFLAGPQVKQLIMLVDKMEQAQVALDAKLKVSEVRRGQLVIGFAMIVKKLQHCCFFGRLRLQPH